MDMNLMTTDTDSVISVRNDSPFAWEDLRFFLGFCQHRSLAAAARSLSVEHATVARRITALEQSLRLRLVDRRSRKYELTPVGERIAQLGLDMQLQASAISRIASSIREAHVADITLHCPPSLATHIIAPQLGRLRAECPAVNLHLLADSGKVCLSRGEADIDLRWGRPTEPELVARKVTAVEFGFYASPDYLQNRLPSAYEFISYDEYVEGSTHEQWLTRAAAGRPVVVRAKYLDILAMAAQAGAGIALLPCFSGDSPLNSLQRVGLEDSPMTLELWLTVHGDMRHAAHMRKMLDFVYSCFNPDATLLN